MAASIAATSTAPGIALAQDAQAASVDESAIVVTARRRDENAQDVPIAITAVSSKTIEELRVVQAEDLEILEPTFSVSSSSGYVNKNVYALRGIRPTESIYGQDPTVQVYLADVVQSPSQGSNLGFYDLENIQILKGPQGTLFGRNTIGGAILLTPRKPGYDFAVDAMVGAGSFGLFETEVGVDIPVAPTFRLRLAGRTIDSDGYQTNVGTGAFNGTKYGGEKTRSIRATMVADLTDRIRNTTMVTYDDKNTNGRIQVLQAINPDNALIAAYASVFGTAFQDTLERARNRDINDVESNLDNYDDVEAWSVTNTTVAELSGALTFKSILNYREVDSRTSIDLDSSEATILHSTPQYANLDHHSVELQLQSDGDRFDWTLGGFYYHEKGEEYSPGVFFPALLGAINPIIQRGIVDNTSYAVFGQGSYKLTDKLTATVGARMNWDKKGLTLNSFSGSTCSLQVYNDATADPNDLVRLPNDDCFLPLSETFSKPTGSVSLDYKVTPDVLVYATSRLGYRSGGFNLRGDIPVEYAPFGSETVVDLEGGIKSDYSLGMMAMRTNVAVYHQWYSDIQRTVAVANAGGSPGSAVENAAKARVFGIELNQMLRPTDWLTFDLSYAYIKPRYKSYIDPATGTDLSDTPFQFTPRHSGSVRGTIEAPLGNDAGTLRFVANASWQDEIWINSLHTIETIREHPPEIVPLLKQKAYWVVDLSAGWDNVMDTGIDLSAYVRNLFDEEYKVGGIQLYTGATGFIAAAYGRPRSAGVQMRFRF
ncbi:hypothetical protein B2G71_13945 [Novosphingobium sp. PC22D]|nr:hypothetical protein B2G71_13945 [Novosphingobium sp. PC22D]